MLNKILIGSETGETAAVKINHAFDVIDSLTAGQAMTPQEIKQSYESNVDTNCFNDADMTKLRSFDPDKKVDVEPGKGLSEKNFTAADQVILADVINKVDKRPGYALSKNDYNDAAKLRLSQTLTTDDLQTPVTPSNKIATMVDIGTGGGGGATTLDGLTDVEAGSPTDWQVLTFEAGTGKWKAKDSQGGTGSGYTKAEADAKFATITAVQGLKLSSLSDFSGTPAAGQILEYDGTNWIPKDKQTTTTGGSF